ncbi:class I SAM-dependent methyltransferase [Nocardioides sp. W3-2-3]|nr:class I SAM-dependent methyltransferase [Nocardioides convexus]
MTSVAAGERSTPLPSLVSWILDRSALAPGAPVLDPACGTGHFLVAAAQRVGVAAVHGSDLDAEAVRIARDRLAALDPSVPAEPDRRAGGGRRRAHRLGRPPVRRGGGQPAVPGPACGVVRPGSRRTPVAGSAPTPTPVRCSCTTPSTWSRTVASWRSCSRCRCWRPGTPERCGARSPSAARSPTSGAPRCRSSPAPRCSPASRSSASAVGRRPTPTRGATWPHRPSASPPCACRQAARWARSRPARRTSATSTTAWSRS